MLQNSDLKQGNFLSGKREGEGAGSERDKDREIEGREK
jgi:hypothetical protein